MLVNLFCTKKTIIHPLRLWTHTHKQYTHTITGYFSIYIETGTIISRTSFRFCPHNPSSGFDYADGLDKCARWQYNISKCTPLFKFTLIYIHITDQMLALLLYYHRNSCRSAVTGHRDWLSFISGVHVLLCRERWLWAENESLRQ